MANRRMFSMKIIDTDAFLDMPVSAQNLYFHLCMRADDDGFVSNPKKVMRMVGSTDDDYKILCIKRFLIQFPSGICVIKHWLIHNYIQKDRYEPSQWIEEKNSLSIKENKVYTECIQDVSNLLPQVRLEVDKDSISNNRSKKEIYSDGRFVFFWNEYPNKVGKGKAWQAWLKLKPTNEVARKIVESVRKYRQTVSWKKDNGQFIPHAATFLNQRRFDDEVEITNGSVTEF